MKSQLSLAVLTATVAVPAVAADIVTLRYTCERGVEVPAVYINPEPGPGVAVIHVEGRLIALETTRAASGVRYVPPSDGSGYIWWTKGNTARLDWQDAASGTGRALLEECQAQD